MKIGDTITDAVQPTAEPFPGYKEVKPLVSADCIPLTRPNTRICAMRSSSCGSTIRHLSMSRKPRWPSGSGSAAAFSVCYMEIIQERLEREYGLTLITTAPTVVYRVSTTKGEVLEMNNPAELPPPNSIERFEEPFILATVITPERYMGAILQLCQERRGTQRSIHFLDPTRVLISYEMPLNEVILDFDKLKSARKGMRRWTMSCSAIGNRIWSSSTFY